MKISIFWAVFCGIIVAVLIILLARLIGKVVDIVRSRVWDFFNFKNMEELKISLDAALIAMAIAVVVVYVLKFLKKRFEEYL